MHRFDIHVTPGQADLALRRFLLRQAGIGSLVAALFCLVIVVLDARDGALDPMSIVLLTLFAVLLFLYVTVFVVRRRQMHDLLARIGDHPVTYELEDWVVTARSALGRSSIKWELIRKLWIDPDLILLFYSRGAYSTLPTSQVPADSLRFLAAKVREFGGTVRDRRPSAD